MAAPSNTYTTYDMRGKAEEVDNKIYNLDPTKTPFLSSLSSFKVSSRNPEWQEDSNAAANKDNASIEGNDFAGEAQSPTFMLRNTIQTFTKRIVTSGLANEIKKYGRSNEHTYQLGKATIEIRTDIEAAMLSNNAAVVGDGSTASKMAGLELYCTVNKSHANDGSTAALSNATSPATQPTDGTTRTLTKAILTSLLRTMWDNGGKPRVCYLSMTQKEVVNGFTGLNTPHTTESRTGMGVSVIGMVDIFVYETGALAFVPMYSDRIRSRTLFLTDGESIQRGYVRPIQRQKMGKTGDSDKTQLITDVTVKVNDRRAIGKIADLS